MDDPKHDAPSKSVPEPGPDSEPVFDQPTRKPPAVDDAPMRNTEF